MILSSILEKTVDNPCKDVVNHAAQCLMETFLSIPETVLRHGLMFTTMIVAIGAWLAIIFSALVGVLFVAKKFYKVMSYVLIDVLEMKNVHCLQALLLNKNKATQEDLKSSQNQASKSSTGLAKLDTKYVKGFFKGLTGFVKTNNQQQSEQSQTTSRQQQDSNNVTSSPVSPPPKNRLSKLTSPRALALGGASDQQMDSPKTK